MWNVPPTFKKELRRRAASYYGGKREIMLRSQHNSQHASPKLTHAELKSDCLKVFSSLPEFAYSRISEGALADPTNFFKLLVGPHRGGVFPV